MDKKFEEFMNATKLGELIHGKTNEKKESPYTVILVILGAIALIAAIAYAVYYFFVPDRIVDFDDEFEEYDDGLFDDEFDEFVEDVEDVKDTVADAVEDVVDEVKDKI